MNGAESLLQTLINNNVDVCFTNPGTSEMHFVAALDEVSGMRCVLCLFEGVLSGAAGAYALMAGKPASTLLHLGPGLGNAIANLHNAKKGNVPIVNIVGDHATYHLKYDAPLTADIESMAGTVSHWVYTSKSPDDIAKDTFEAIQQAGVGKIATLILPADVSWGDNKNGAVAHKAMPITSQVGNSKIKEAVKRLKSSKNAMIMIGGREVTAAHTLMLSQLSKATGARVCTEVFPSKIARGAGTGVIERLPYLAEQAIEYIKDVEDLILIGAKEPISFFAYPNVPSRIVSEKCDVYELAGPDDDYNQVLEALISDLNASGVEPDVYPLSLAPLGSGTLDVPKITMAVNHLMPENAIVVDEAITSSLVLYPNTLTTRAHDWLNLTGGSIGWGLPAAVGAAVAQPDRKVICLQGDGSAMYTVEAMWTMARENLDVLIVIFNNQKYSVLELEFQRTGARGGTPGPIAASTLQIGNPNLNFVQMAQGMGVSASRATTAEEFNEQMEKALNTKGPHLIDAMVPTIF